MLMLAASMKREDIWGSNLQSMDYSSIWKQNCDISHLMIPLFFVLFTCWIVEINNPARQGEVTGKIRLTHLVGFNDLLRQSTMVFPHDMNIDSAAHGNL